METITLHQVKCPECGSVVMSYSPLANDVECPYCHQMMRTVEALAVKREVTCASEYMPFTSSLQDFGQHLVNALVKRKYVPQDIFSFLNAENAMKIYLPMFVYEGKYHVRWSGYTEEKNSKDGTSEKQWHDGFVIQEFAVMAPAYESGQLPDELKQFAATFPYDAAAMKPFDITSAQEENVATVEANANADAVWSSTAKKQVEEMAEKAAQHDAPNGISRFKHDTHIDIYSNGKLVLIPFWFVYYNYRQERYFFIMDGSGRKEKLTAPVDADQKKEANKYNIYYWILGILLIIGIVVAYFKNPAGPFIIGAAVLGVIGMAIFDRMRRKKIHNAAQEIRKEGAARFLGQ